MEVSQPIDYMYFLAFIIVYRFDYARREINLKDLNEFRQIFLSQVIDDYENETENDKEYFEDDEWNGKVRFEKINFIESIYEFIDKYSDFFYLEDKCIKLYDNVSYDDLANELTELSESVNPRITNNTYDEFLLIALHANGLKNDFIKYLNIERKYEITFYNYLYDKNSDYLKKLKLLFITKNIMKHNMEMLDDLSYDSLRILSNIELSNQDFEFDEFPSDSSIVCDENGEERDLFDFFYDLYPSACFGEEALAYLKCNKELTDRCISNNIGNNILEYDNDNSNKVSNDQYYFYLKLIKNIKDFLVDNPEYIDINEYKNRLLYSIDYKGLFIDEELNNEIKSFDCYEFSDDLSDLKYASVAMIATIFNNLDSTYNIIRALFIKTYYDISSDDYIEDVFNEYKDDSSYEVYRNVIFGKNKRLIK